MKLNSTSYPVGYIALLFIYLIGLNSGLVANNIKPNVLTIILDDAGYRDVGYQGADFETPVIDALAKDGTRFTQFYAYSTCTPSRAAFFSGRAPSRMGIVYPIQHDDHYGLPDSIVTLPEYFQEKGYQTALIGKWHLGAEQGLAPLSHGFDYHYGLRGGWFDQYTRVNPVTGYDWYRNNNLLDAEQGHTTDLLTDDAVRYLGQHGNNPFFLCLSYTAPHVPIQVDPKWIPEDADKYATKTRIGYVGMMRHLDASIGRVVSSLKKQGLLDNTLIVFFSDNGPSEPGKKWYVPEDFHQTHFYGNDGQYGDVGELRGWKSHPYEGGIRVPAFIHWKGYVEEGDWDHPVIVEDMYRTILGLLDWEPPTDNSPEGMDVFASTDKPIKHYWRTPRNLCLRYNQWKLVIHGPSPFEDQLDSELYDLQADPNEKKDLANGRPEKKEQLISILKSEFVLDAEPYVNPNLLDK